MSDGDRTVLIDASVVITLAAIDETGLLAGLRGDPVIPGAVADEIETPPAADVLDEADWLSVRRVLDSDQQEVTATRRRAETHLPDRAVDGSSHGDLALLTLALLAVDSDAAADSDAPRSAARDPSVVVVTDDKPLRKTCKALSIPVSGSIGVLIRAVERGDLDPATATDRLYAMDEVGARLSARLVRRAERLIDEAGDDAS